MEDRMNRASVIALVIGAMLFGCGAGMVASEVLESEADAQVAWTGQTWEYTFDSWMTTKKTKDGINELGREGWEMVNADGTVVWFKRPLP